MLWNWTSLQPCRLVRVKQNGGLYISFEFINMDSLFLIMPKPTCTYPLFHRPELKRRASDGGSRLTL